MYFLDFIGCKVFDHYVKTRNFRYNKGQYNMNSTQYSDYNGKKKINFTKAQN